MPTPAWTAQYDFTKTPAGNGFTQVNYGNPTLTLNQHGTNQNVTITNPTSADSVVFLTSNVPALDSTVGATCEMIASVTGAGDAGFELGFLNQDVQVLLLANSVLVSVATDGIAGNVNTTVATPSNGTATTIRATIDGGANLNVYRNGVLVVGPIALLPFSGHKFQNVLWWGEAGGTQTFTELAYYIGGAVAP